MNSPELHKRPSRWFVVCAALACVGVFAVIRLGWGQSRDAAERMDRGNLAKSVFLMAWLYAEEHDHVLPELDARHGALTYRGDGAHPAYKLDGKLSGPLDDPRSPLVLGDLDGYKAYTLKPIANMADYVYLGYAFETEAQALDLIAACRDQLAHGQGFASELPAGPGRGSYGGGAFVRLRSDAAQALQDQGIAAGDAALRLSRIPALIELPKPGPHPGGWVVYLDRHADYLPYPGPFPMTESVIAGLESLAAASQR